MSHRPGRATLFGALICVTVIGWQGVPVTTLAKPLDRSGRYFPCLRLHWRKGTAGAANQAPQACPAAWIGARDSVSGADRRWRLAVPAAVPTSL